MAYDFSALNDKEFEGLAMDILNARFKLDLQSFKSGKDKGIDLRFSSPKNNNEIVVQAKQYIKSGYRALVRDLVKSEFPKVKRLQPTRYMLVTALPLSATNKDEICKKFKPFIKTPNDIFGQDDLNKYLSKLPEIETSWYKLWLSSVPVLTKILHNAVTGRSDFYEGKIRKNIQRYVYSVNFDDAFDILRKYKYILITGLPGVGKTMLADFLTYHLLAQKYKLVYIDSDLKDAEDIIAKNPKTKQVFYFDDFLGANYLEIMNPKTPESKFVSFLDRIKNSPNKYLILTTRTIIYRTAIERFEKLKRASVDIARREIQLGHYSDLDKAKILYNHIYHSALPDEKKKEIFKDKAYMAIINHQNYNPRLIEFVTDPVNSTDIKKGQYLAFVTKHLNNPEEVWRHAYEQQITVEEKLLMHAVFTQQNNANEGQTKQIFDSFLHFEMESYHFRPGPSPFKNAHKKLLDGILRREVIVRNDEARVSFINPSLSDFLTSYFYENPEERWKLIQGLTYIEQFEQMTSNFFAVIGTRLTNIEEESTRLALHILGKAVRIKSFSTSITGLKIASLLNRFKYLDKTSTQKIEQYTAGILRSVRLDRVNSGNWKYYMNCIRRGNDESLVGKFLLENWDAVIRVLISGTSEADELGYIRDLFDEYRVDFDAFMSRSDNRKFISDLLNAYVKDQTEAWYRDEKSTIYTERDYERMIDTLKDQRGEIFSKFDIDDDSFDDDLFFMDDVEDIIAENTDYRDYGADDRITPVPDKRSVRIDMPENEIDRLFESPF